MDCKGAHLFSQVPGHELQASEEIVMDIYMCCFIATLDAAGNMQIFFFMLSLKALRKQADFR